MAPGVYVGARQGASANSSRGVVEWEIFRNTKIEGDIGANSNGQRRREDGMGLLSALALGFGPVTALIFLLVAIAMMAALGGRRGIAGRAVRPRPSSCRWRGWCIT